MNKTGKKLDTVGGAQAARSLASPDQKVFAALNHRHTKTVNGISTATQLAILATLFHAVESVLRESR